MEMEKNEGQPESVKIGDYFLTFEKEEVSSESFYVQKAAKELGETPKLKEESLIELKRLIAQDSNLNISLNDEEIDLYLSAYLRISKFYVNSALEKIKYLFYCRLKYPDYFAHIIPIHEKNAFQNNLLTTLPNRDQQGRRILVLQLGSKWKPRECSLIEIIRGIMLLIEGAILEPRTQVSGAVLIVDLEGMSLQHVWQFSPSFAKMLLDWVQDSMPLRLKEIHVVKQPYVFNMAFAIFKPFMREKLKKRTILHGTNTSSLLNYIDAKYVPIRYGGLMDISMDHGLTQWNFFCAYNKRYERTSNYGFEHNPKDDKTQK